MIPVPSPPLNSPEWEKWRQDESANYLSASESAAAANLSPFMSARDLLAEKLWPEGMPPDLDRDWRFKIAHATQGLLIDLANDLVIDAHPLNPNRFTENHTTYRHQTIPWMIGTPDGFTHTPRPQPVEVKFTSGWSADHPPAHVMAQLLVQTWICEVDTAWLVVARPHVKRLLDVRVVSFTVDQLDDAVDGYDFAADLHGFWATLQSQRPQVHKIVGRAG